MDFKLVAVIEILQAELLLVHVRLRHKRKIHVGHREGSHAPLFHNMAGLCLEPLVEVKHHRHAGHTQLDHKICVALLLVIIPRSQFGCRSLTDKIHHKVRLLQVKIAQLDIAHQRGQPSFVDFRLEADIAQDKFFDLLDQVSLENFLVALQIVFR